MPDADPELFDKIVNLCKRRGFVFPSAEIYGGFRSTYDYGPLGVLMLRNVKDAWWRSMVQLRDDVVGLDAAILVAAGRCGRRRATWPNFTDPLVDCTQLQGAVPPRQARRPRHVPQLRRRRTRSPRPASSTSCSRPTPGRSRTPAPRPTCGPRRRRACSSTSRTCCRPAARSRRSASPRSASRSATRSRPATSCSAPASSSRWRWSTSCRPPRRRSGTSTGARSATDWYLDLGIPADKLRLRPHDADELVALLVGHVRRGVPLPLGLGRARGHRQPRRLRPHPARQALGREARVLRPGHQRALRAPRDRAGRRRHPHDDGVPHGRLRRGGGAGRDAHRAAPPPPPRAVQGGRAARCRRRTRSRRWPARCCASSSRTSCATTTRRRPSAAATAARTRSARRSASRSTSKSLEDRAVTVRDRDSMAQERVAVDDLLTDYLRPSWPDPLTRPSSWASATPCCARRGVHGLRRTRAVRQPSPRQQRLPYVPPVDEAAAARRAKSPRGRGRLELTAPRRTGGESVHRFRFYGVDRALAGRAPLRGDEVAEAGTYRVGPRADLQCQLASITLEVDAPRCCVPRSVASADHRQTAWSGSPRRRRRWRARRAARRPPRRPRRGSPNRSSRVRVADQRLALARRVHPAERVAHHVRTAASSRSVRMRSRSSSPRSVSALVRAASDLRCVRESRWDVVSTVVAGDPGCEAPTRTTARHEPLERRAGRLGPSSTVD